MFSSIIKIFQRDKKDSLDEQIHKSVEDFKNRPVHIKLTAEIIDVTSDDELLFTVFENLAVKLEGANKHETFLMFSKARQAAYAIWLLEAEVNNGGFNQYYYNSSGQYAELTPGALQLIGANKFANLVSKANKIYETENKKITEHLDGTVEGFSESYDENPLNELDTEFYELYKAEDLHKLQVDFIRNNKSEFIDV